MLEKIQSPKDLEDLSKSELILLAKEIRERIVTVVGNNGGHLASNLGVVDLTIALHRVFNNSQDAIIWDVSHQCYAHKILTGRNSQFDTLRKKNGLSGFTKNIESPYDWFDAGHSSTSISTALGLLTGRDLLHSEGKVVAVIGDGALTGGMAFEALSHVGQLHKNLVIVLNDNQMSISSNTGAISKYLGHLTTTPQYQSFRYNVDRFVDKIPFLGKPLTRFIFKFKRGIKSIVFPNNLFSDLGLEYVGPLNGHHIGDLITVFERVKKLDRPVVVHVVTQKGRGYGPSEKDPVTFHGVGPFNTLTGKVPVSNKKTFTQVFSDKIVELGERDSRVVAITAAMTTGTGLDSFAEKFPHRFFDVGIAEQHAVTFAAGLARSGIKPVVAIYSTFIQRAVDQLIHDIALQKLPAIFVLDRSGPVPEDGETHQGIFDISLLRPVPNVSLLSPATKTQLEKSLEWAISENVPVIIRYPKGTCPKEVPEFNAPIEKGRGLLVPNKVGKSDILYVCTGGIFSEVLEASRLLSEQKVYTDIYNLLFLKPLDKEYFINLASQYHKIVFVEDGIRIGGIGTYLESLLARSLDHKITAVCGFPDRFLPQGTRSQILEDAHLSPDYLAKKVLSL